MKYDDDISKLDISEIEKNGLQIYRNYTASFQKNAEEKFRSGIDDFDVDIGDFSKAVEIISQEDIRFMPMVVCSYGDEKLKEVIGKCDIDGIPGGKSSFSGVHGPASDLFSRIQLCYAFDLISKDIILSLDTVRKVRNKMAHSLDIGELKNVLGLEINSVCEILDSDFDEKLTIGDEERIKIQAIWLMARFCYEVPMYFLAKKSGLEPSSTLYTGEKPELLKNISQIALNASREISS